jgi:hypothetical protein|nr:MAG TPA: DNA primase [Crassvirales sp.]
MGRNINSSKLTKQLILSKVSQVTIFSTYLNLSDKIVQYCIDTGELICSPIRDDIHPTCGFRYDNKGKLKFRDFAGYFWGDCFDIVALIMGGIYNKQYDISNREDFVKVLRHITFTFKDIFYGQEKDINLINEINTGIVAIKHKKPNIELVVRNWNEYDKEYWGKFGVPLQYLNINFIYPVEQYYINRKINPEPKYFYNANDPCYGYCLGQDRSGVYNIKLYFPNRNKTVTRFITNCNHLEGIYNLDKTDYDIIVITKSTKDRVSLGAAILRINSLYGGVDKKVGVINIPHETYKLRQNEFDWLKGKLSDRGKIVSLMDNDSTGKHEAIWLRNNYQITPLLIPVIYCAKDFAELVSKHKFDEVVNLIKQTINYISNYERKNNKLTWNTTEWSNNLPY